MLCGETKQFLILLCLILEDIEQNTMNSTHNKQINLMRLFLAQSMHKTRTYKNVCLGYVFVLLKYILGKADDVISIQITQLENSKVCTLMIHSKCSRILNTLIYKLRVFLLKETSLSPFLYFLLFAYFHSPLETPLEQLPCLLFLFAVVVAVIAKFNFLYTLAPWTQSGALIAVPMLGIGLLSCTKKWKMYLFLLAVGDSAFTSTSQHYFLAIFSGLICCEIHRNFIFTTLSQNMQYFTGMAGICAYYVLTILQDYFKTAFLLEIHFILVLTSASLAHAFIKHQTNKLIHTDPKYIYSGRLMAHYLRAIGETANDVPLLRTRIRSHSRGCRESNCFCHSNEHGEKAEYLMRQLYENALERFKGENDSLLLENYVQFLLKNGQDIKALHFLSEWQPQGYFSVLAHERARARVERQLRDANSSNIYELQYEYALEYGQHYQRVAVGINAILKLKLQFWREVSKQTPRVSRMQTLGDEIIAKMYELNIFYSKVVQLEHSLFLFDVTALYAMYMLSTTNFKEYSELIIKNTAKLLEEVYLVDSGSSQTFAIRTVVHHRDNCFMENSEEGLKPLKKLATQHSFMDLHENGCKLVIDAVSEGLCKVVGVRRTDLIGQELNTIIPQGYKEVHNVRLSYLLDFQSESLKEIVPSKVMHKELKLPMKCNNNGLAMAYVCIKFLVDPKEGLTFISVVKSARDRSSYVLMDFEGRVTESENGFNKEILRHSQIQRYLQRLRQTWQEEKMVPEQSFNLMINTANYCITISSPLLGLFLQKENLKQKCPPIHLQITNEESTRNRNVQADRYNKVGMQIQHMQHAINAYDAQSSNSTSRSGSSAVNVINTFSESDSHPVYRLLQLAFLITILTCVLSNLAAFFVTSLPWDPSVATQNPLNDTMNMYALQMLTIKAVLIIVDQRIYFQTGSAINRTRVSQYFGNESFESNMARVTHQMETAYKDSIRNILGTPSKLLQPYINQRLSTLLTVKEPSRVGQILSTRSQNITYLDLLMLYVSDLNLLTRLNTVAPTLEYSFTIPVALTQNCSFLSPIIDKAVQDSQFLATAVHIGLMVAIALLVIPSFILLKRRLSLQEKVFDLLASIDAQQVASEIHSLQHVANILRNSKESSEIMKMNVVDYQEHALNPKGPRKNSSDNEMVFGLEKYDNSQENQELALQKYASKTPPNVAHLSSHKKIQATPQSTGSLRAGSLKQSTLLGIIKESYLSTQAEQSQNMRKRSGELQLEGSELDPARRVIGGHCLLYLIFLSFLLILGLSMKFKLDFDAQYLKGKNELISIYTDQIRFEVNLVSAKIAFGQGSKIYGYFFGLKDPLPGLVALINRMPKYNYNDGLQLYSQIIQNCSSSAPPFPAKFAAKYCQYDYSEVLLKGEFGSLFKQLIEYRYLVDTGAAPPGMNSTAILQNITEKVYYLQSLNIRIQELVLMKVNLLFAGLAQLGDEYALKQGVMLVASGVWGIICFVLGWGVIVRMKRSYFKQVFMITFLNSEMILKNKRVESFLDALAKNVAT